jgi:hypothetical protein
MLYGISSDSAKRGLCYYNDPLRGLDESISDVFAYSKLIPFFNFSSIPNTNIFSNELLENELTYQDSIRWGCADYLNITGLKYYCTNQLWKKKNLYEIFNNLTYVGHFGNPNRQFLSDWVTVDKLTIDSYTSNWDSFNNKCTLPAVINVDILYATYGLVNNTQHAIYKVQFRLDYIDWWVKKLYTKDYYQTYININYYRIPQEKVSYFAPAPGFIVFPRNIMYPFKIGTTQYNTAVFFRLDNFFLLVIILILL